MFDDETVHSPLLLAAGLGNDSIEHLRHETLLRAGQLADALYLLMQFRGRSAFGGAAGGAEQDIDRHGERGGERR